jgi:diguanylate cyclase (GGDEF)-like protein
MDIGLRVNIDLLCSQIIALLYAGVQSRKERKKLDYRLFVYILLLVCIELFADSAIWLTNGSASKFEQILLRNATFVFFAVNPFITMVYAIYIEFTTLPLHRRNKRLVFMYFIPAALILCLCFLSLFTNWLFWFDDHGFSHRGRLSYISIAAFYGYLAWALAVVHVRRKTISPNEFKGLVSFPVPMAFCGVLQLLLPDYAILLPSFSLSLITLNSSIHERRLMYDYLTGAFNRRRLDEYLDAMITDCRNSGKVFSALLADVNDFKQINDRFGHLAGDDALIAVVKLMRANLRFDDFLARYAGEEFVIILPNTDKHGLDEIIERIHASFELHSHTDSPYKLSISIGASEFDPAFKGDAEEYISHLDSLMYEQKKRFHEE